MTELLFEIFKSEGLYISNSAIMPFYSNGITTGLVCDSGHGYTSISSMFEGFFKTNAI